MGATVSCLGGGSRDFLKKVEQGQHAEVSLLLAQNPARLLAFGTLTMGNTAWHKAAKYGHLDILEEMVAVIGKEVSYAKDVEQNDFSGMSELCKYGLTVKDITTRLVNRVNYRGQTPLMLAVESGHPDVVEHLLTHGADPWIRDRMRGETCLHYAVEMCQLTIMTTILSQPTLQSGHRRFPPEARLVNVASTSGLTPLHYACFLENAEMVRVLLNFGADINVQAEYPDGEWLSLDTGDTPMHCAAINGNLGIVRLLLKTYIERNGPVLPSGAPQPARELTQQQRDPRAFRNEYGRLPYHLAMRGGHTFLAEWLDPSVPVRYLLSGEEFDSLDGFGPARLAVIAASVLHTKLLGELDNVELAEQINQAIKQSQKEMAVIDSASENLVDKEQGPPLPNPSWGSCSTEEEDMLGEIKAGDLVPVVRVTPTTRRMTRAMSLQDSWLTQRLLQSPDGPEGALEKKGAQELSSRRPTRKSMAVLPEESEASKSALTSPASPFAAMATSPLAGLELHAFAGYEEEVVLPGRPHSESPNSLPEAVHVTPLKGESGTSSSYLLSFNGVTKAEFQVTHSFKAPVQGSGEVTAVTDIVCRRSPGTLIRTESEKIPAHRREYPLAGDHYRPQPPPLPMPLDTWLAFSNTDRSSCQEHGLTSETSTKDEEAHPPASPATVLVETPSEICLTCDICLDAPVNVAIEPCGHHMCTHCARDLCKRYSVSTALCPFCRAIIARFSEYEANQAQPVEGR